MSTSLQRHDHAPKGTSVSTVKRTMTQRETPYACTHIGRTLTHRWSCLHAYWQHFRPPIVPSMTMPETTHVTSGMLVRQAWRDAMNPQRWAEPIRVVEPSPNSADPHAPQPGCRHALTRVPASRRVHRGLTEVSWGRKNGIGIPCLRGPDPVFTPDVNTGSQEQSVQGRRRC